MVNRRVLALGIGKHFIGGHQVIKHSLKQYSVGTINTNTAESYFALLKRGVMGTFHHISRKHLHRYCHEFDFRWNMRKNSDYERTVKCIQQSKGKRLLYQTPVKGTA